MRAKKRFRAAQPETMQVAAESRKAPKVLRLVQSPSPVQGGFAKSPSPSGDVPRGFLPPHDSCPGHC